MRRIAPPGFDLGSGGCIAPCGALRRRWL